MVHPAHFARETGPVPRSNRQRRSGRRAAPSGRGEEAAPLDLDRVLGGMERRESGADGTWVVRRVVGTPGRSYRCPGCDHEVVSGTAHVVAWPAEPLLGQGPEHRRHWHSACWSSRGRRGPR